MPHDRAEATRFQGVQLQLVRPRQDTGFLPIEGLVDPSVPDQLPGTGIVTEFHRCEFSQPVVLSHSLDAPGKRSLLNCARKETGQIRVSWLRKKLTRIYGILTFDCAAKAVILRGSTGITHVCNRRPCFRVETKNQPFGWFFSDQVKFVRSGN